MKRSFNVCGKDQLYLGIDDYASSYCNGILFPVTKNELSMLEIREKYYKLKK